MGEYDIVVVGGGTGNKVARAAANRGQRVALIERGPLGGTCVNRGCNPSKTLIHRADVAETVRHAGEFGIDADLDRIDFPRIVREVTEMGEQKSDEIARAIEARENVTLYRDDARFVGERTLRVGDEEIRGDKISVAVGARPAIPPIDGLDDVDYLTSTDALRLDRRPDRLVVIGGGYIAAELGYFYEALGTAVTIIGRNDVLVPAEDREVAETFTEIARRRHTVHVGYEATAVTQENGQVTVTATSDDGEPIAVTADELLVATGRRPNTDRLDSEKAGIHLDERGYIETDEFLETSAENVWAHGDCIRAYQFKHAADHEVTYVIKNALDGEREAVDYTGMGHAVFTSPQVAGTGKTEEELVANGREYAVGRCAYRDTVMGNALKDRDGFVKVLAAPDGEILGCHIVGPDASTLIHEVLLALSSGSGTVNDVTGTIHIHPALSKVVLRAFEDVELP